MTSRAGGIVVLVGLIGWAGLIWLAIQLYGTTPPTAGFDLELVLAAGRAVAAGRTPYDPAMLAGAAPVAERLFYSYPPVVAQAASLVAAIPSPVIFGGLVAVAVAGLGHVAHRLTLAYGSGPSPTTTALVTMALSPLLFPFAVGLVFGNLDVLFPFAFGLLLLGVAPGAGAAAVAGAGVSTTLASVAKLHPASIGLWFLARAPGDRDARRVVTVAIVSMVAIVGLSLAVGGIQIWLDYVTVVRAGSGADIVDPRNAGPAAQLALLLAGSGRSAESMARTLQIAVTGIALIATVVAARRLADPVEGLAWAVAASLVVLPVTWYHYPAALIPFALVAVVRSWNDVRVGRRVRVLVTAAAVIAAVAIAWLPLLYVAIGLVLAAVHGSRPRPATAR